MFQVDSENAQRLVALSKMAGNAILEVYNDSIEVEYKKDHSPLTIADTKSHEIIIENLPKIANFPILSEEGVNIPYNVRKEWDYYWLVDPLDGTKEFIKKNGEFTVNIALIHKNKPILGVVYAPVFDTAYCGGENIGAWKQENSNSEPFQIYAKSFDNSQNVKIVSSRSHPSEALALYLEQFPNRKLLPMGSSLKLCLVAEGLAHIYPRLGPTMEWDTGAAHAIVEAAGGQVLEYNTKMNLVYNKENLLNPWFVVSK
jgi:3'(2'), 5'-bisphosphate nucleotidase